MWHLFAGRQESESRLPEILANVHENKKWFSYQLFLCYFNLNPKITYFLKSCKNWVLKLSSLHWDALGWDNDFSVTLSSSAWIHQNKSSSFCSNILGDTTLQILRSEENTKSSLVPIRRYENLTDLFRILPGYLQMSSRRFHLYSFIKLSKNEAFKHFLSHFCWMVFIETTTVMKILISIFGEYSQVGLRMQSLIMIR